MTVRQLLASMSSPELAEWMAYERVEPFGQWRADYRQAITSMLIANANRGKKDKAYEVGDFMVMPEDRPKKKIMDWRKMKQVFQAICKGRKK